MNLAALGNRLLDRCSSASSRRFGVPHAYREQISKRYLARFLPRHPVIVDCGAHVGHDSFDMAMLWPQATIHAFEPVPAVFRELDKRMADVNNVRCYNLAISDKTGFQEMFVSGGTSDGSSSLLRPAEHLRDHPTVRFDEKVMVPTATFAEWAAREGVARVDFFWLDMQGFELQAMAASRDLLRSASAIHTEVSTRYTYDGVALYPELRSWLDGEGFVVAVQAIPDGWDMGNVLFVRRELLR